MRLATRTTLTMLLCAGVPLGLAGWSAIRLARAALYERAGALHAVAATSVAQVVRDALAARITGAQHAAATIDFGALSPEALRGALRLVYRQIDGATAVALFDPAGAQVGVVEYLTTPQPQDAVLAGRPVLSSADVEAFGAHLPIAAAREVGAAVSRVYVGAAGDPRLTVAVRSPTQWVLTVGLSLAALQNLVIERRVSAVGRAFVIDADGRVVLDGDGAAVAAREDRSSWPAIALLLAGHPMPRELDDPTLGASLGAAAPLADLGWHAVVTEPEDAALAAAALLTRQTLAWLLAASVAAVLLGVLSARRVARPIGVVHAGAVALQRGDMAHRVGGADRQDELGEVAAAFNAMAAEVQRWRQELEARVDERTRELREAQQLLLRSQKLAAVGELGAGVAHHINNPLTAIISMAQLVKRKTAATDPNRRFLDSIESEGLRIHQVVSNLLRLTEDRPDHELRPLRVESALDAALSLAQGQLDAAKVELVRAYAPGVPEVRGNEVQLTEAFLHLIQNARKAMPRGGRLIAEVAATDGELVSVRIKDSGIGIPAELRERVFEPFFSDRKEWGSTGMGLPLVHRVAQSHQGRVLLESEEGKGSTFTMLLPARAMRSLA